MYSKPVKIRMPLYNALNMLKSEQENESFSDIILSLLKYDFNNTTSNKMLPEDGFILEGKKIKDFNYQKYLGITKEDINDITKRQNFLKKDFYDNNDTEINKNTCTPFIYYFVEANYGLIIGVVIDEKKSMNNKYHIFDMVYSYDKINFKP